MLLSIITINYNNSLGLERTIKSVISQTYSDFEYIVVDGGSTDGSVEIIKKYSDKIDHWVSEPDKGIYNAMNKGVRMAHGEYVVFLNSGDVFYEENVLSNVIAQDLNADIYVGDLISTDGSLMKAPEPDELTMSWLLRGSVAHPSSFTKRKLLLDLPFDERTKIDGDHLFFLKAFVKLNASYQQLKGIISVFDLTGISSTQSEPEEDQRLFKEAVEEILPPRVRDDYDIFMGKRDDYHKLFYELSFSRYAKWIYRLVAFVLKIVTLNDSFMKKYKIKSLQ